MLSTYTYINLFSLSLSVLNSNNQTLTYQAELSTYINQSQSEEQPQQTIKRDFSFLPKVFLDFSLLINYFSFDLLFILVLMGAWKLYFSSIQPKIVFPTSKKKIGNHKCLILTILNWLIFLWMKKWGLTMTYLKPLIDLSYHNVFVVANTYTITVSQVEPQHCIVVSLQNYSRRI